MDVSQSFESESWLMYVFILFILFLHFLVVRSLIVFHVLNLFEVEHWRSNLDPRWCQHEIDLLSILTSKVPTLDYSAQLVLQYNVVTVDHVVKIGMKTLWRVQRVCFKSHLNEVFWVSANDKADITPIGK